MEFLIHGMDITVYYKGYHGDLNETFYVGKVDERYKKLVRVAWECLDLAIKEDCSIQHPMFLIMPKIKPSEL
ncbi:MAP1-like protein [Mya arenaria]|uniref:MAP1-like protein n=1 Tax=Mya arenaria TaxID=6604 RepID=A0ABY7DH23_MYAAR|nr:MAP1-like protein [Mya arenaria]